MAKRHRAAVETAPQNQDEIQDESTPPPRTIVIMGVSGSGKSSVGTALAEACGGHFFDSDHYHPRENVEKMSRGESLTDVDRAPWLTGMAKEVVATAGARDGVTLLACSSLKEKYRDLLAAGDPGGVGWVFLDGDIETIRRRLDARKGHFMKSALLESQFATLERPAGDDVLRVDITASIEEILGQIKGRWPGLWRGVRSGRPRR